MSGTYWKSDSAMGSPTVRPIVKIGLPHPLRPLIDLLVAVFPKSMMFIKSHCCSLSPRLSDICQRAHRRVTDANATPSETFLRTRWSAAGCRPPCTFNDSVPNEVLQNRDTMLAGKFVGPPARTLTHLLVGPVKGAVLSGRIHDNSPLYWPQGPGVSLARGRCPCLARTKAFVSTRLPWMPFPLLIKSPSKTQSLRYLLLNLHHLTSLPCHLRSGRRAKNLAVTRGIAHAPPSLALALEDSQRRQSVPQQVNTCRLPCPRRASVRLFLPPPYLTPLFTATRLVPYVAQGCIFDILCKQKRSLMTKEATHCSHFGSIMALYTTRPAHPELATALCPRIHGASTDVGRGYW